MKYEKPKLEVMILEVLPIVTQSVTVGDENTDVDNIDGSGGWD